MLFEFTVLCLLAVVVSLQVAVILRMDCRGEEEPGETAQDNHQENTEAKRAEKKFSEGVLNVLNYENPMERGKGE